MPITPVTIITDCCDPNATMRLTVRTTALLEAPVGICPVSTESEAALNLIDALDAAAGCPSVVLVNVAPRNGNARKWGNGIPFCAFWVGKTLVVSTAGSKTLSLVHKIDIAEDVLVFEISAVAEWAVANKQLDHAQAERMVNTQFRSFEFLPRLAKWLALEADLPSESRKIDEIVAGQFVDPKTAVWTDSFGNIKTCALPAEVGFESGGYLNVPKHMYTHSWFKVKCYKRLCEVPDVQTGFVIGSSGFGSHRFVELVKQGGSAAQFFRIRPGGRIIA